jgi:hypothetical protein
MKRDAIRAAVVATVKDLGFTSRQYRWMGCELHIVVGGEFRTMRFPAGMTRHECSRQLGRLEGWVEMLNEIAGHEPVVKQEARANGHAAAI